MLGDGVVDLSARAIVQDALRRIEAGTPVVAVESYTRPDGEPALGAFAVPGAIPWASLPWLDLAAVPVVAWLLGWATAQATVRRWLRRLP